MGTSHVLTGRSTRPYLQDATEARGMRGRADAVVLPQDPESVRRVLEWTYAHEVPVCPQGGRTGYAGGSVPDGGVVMALVS